MAWVVGEVIEGAVFDSGCSSSRLTSQKQDQPGR